MAKLTIHPTVPPAIRPTVRPTILPAILPPKRRSKHPPPLVESSPPQGTSYVLSELETMELLRLAWTTFAINRCALCWGV